MKFFTYYTRNTPYEEEVKGLLSSADKLGISIETFAFDSTGNWLRNSSYKYRFMLEMLQRHDEPVVALDADALILKYPDRLFDIHTPIAAHYYSIHGNLADGLLYMTKDALPVCKEVILRCEKEPSVFDQKHLHNIIVEKKIVWTDLPKEYCGIEGFDKEYGTSYDTSVIWHKQASRRFKRSINAGR